MASAELRIINRRIKSVKSTKKITRAMELIAASRIVKAQQRMESSNSYVDVLNKIGVIAFKIPSGEITNKPLLKEISKLKINIIFSTGMSSIREIKEAYKILKKTKKKVIPLYCIISYPTNLDEFDLKKMLNLKKINKQFGFSDHTTGNEASLFAIANGARVIEKHLTLSKKLSGPDHYASMEPNNFRILVKSIRNFESFQLPSR